MMNRYSATAALSAAVFVLGSAMASAQVAVVESSNRLLPAVSTPVVRSVTPAENSVAAAQSIPNDFFYQLQMLQQEVQLLRGLVEEQQYELKRLKQQRLDDYLGLDRRLAALAGSVRPVVAAPSVVGGVVGQAPSDTPVQAVVATPAAGGSATGELQRYRTAIDLALSKKDYVNAIVAFNQYLSDFPEGRYAANSQYWLGEIYLMQGELEQARQRFALLLQEHPDSNKSADATYKLGVVYHRLGDAAKSQQFLMQVAGGTGNAARLAADYLAKHWPK